jgi:hypothetical protein
VVPRMTPSESPREPRSTRQSHGFTNLLKGRYRADLSRVDGRSTLAKTLQAWRADLAHSMGGMDALSAQQAILIDMVVRDRLAIESIESWLAVQPSLVNKRRKSLYPIVQQLASLKDGMTRRLCALGLEGRKPAAIDLASYLSEKKQGDGQ